MNEQTSQAITVLRQGGIVVFPTDTAFGIGCRLDTVAAVKRLFSLRKRSEEKATPVLVSHLLMAQRYLEPVPQEVKEKLVEKYWPGALTIVLPCLKARVPSLVRGGGETLGVRMPNHATILEIIRELDCAVLGPSANFAGEQTPFLFEDLDKELLKLVDFVVEGECTVKQASTVIDCSVNPWQIRRQGAIHMPTGIASK